MLPAFKPEQWVIYVVGEESKYFGKIVGAQYGTFNEKKQWYYKVQNGHEKPAGVMEEKITHYFDGEEFVPVTYTR